MSVSIEDTAENLNVLKPIGDKLKTAFSVARSVWSVYSHYMSIYGSKLAESMSKINFTGQHTDIAFVVENEISDKAIDSISDSKLRVNVKETFNKAVNEGLLEKKRGVYSLTERGRQHINSEPFIAQFEKDQRNDVVEKLSNSAVVRLKGSGDDLNVFRYTDSFNLNQISCGNVDKTQKVIDYLHKCKKYGFVNISDDGTVTPTAKTKQYLKNNQSFDIEVEKVTVKNVDKVTEVMKNTPAVQKALPPGKELKALPVSQPLKALQSGTALKALPVEAAIVIETSKQGAKLLKDSLQTNNTIKPPSLYNPASF